METMTTFQVPDGYSRTKKPLMRTVRHMKAQEVLNLRPGQEIWAIDAKGQLKRVRVNGKVRTGRKDAFRIEVPLKYGLREHFTLNLRGALEYLVVEVT